MFYSISIHNPKIIQTHFVLVLRSQAGICQISFFIAPFFQSTIIEHFQIVLNTERNNIIFQTFLKHNEPAHTTVSVLERMNPLKLHMEVQEYLHFPNIEQLYLFHSEIRQDQSFYFFSFHMRSFYPLHSVSDAGF